MARGRHQKDKLYSVHGELSCSIKAGKSDEGQRHVPYNYCKLRLKPLSTDDQVMSDQSGNFFERVELLTWLKDYGKNPVTGELATQGDFFSVQISRDDEGHPCCPVTGRRYGVGDSYLVNKGNGNLYCERTIAELCRKPGCWVDPVDGSEMKPGKKLIKLQQNTFSDIQAQQDFIKQGGKKKTNKTDPSPTVPPAVILEHRVPERSGLAKRVLNELENSRENYGEKLSKLLRKSGLGGEDGYLDPVTGELKQVKSSLFSTGAAAQSVTSTLANSVGSKQSMRTLTSREYRSLWYDYVRRSKKNLYITFDTMADESLRCVFYAPKAPENVHQVMMNAQMSSYKAFMPVAFERASALLLTGHTEYFNDIDSELTKLEEPNNHLRAGTILLWNGGAQGVARPAEGPDTGLLFMVQGCLIDTDVPLTVLGFCGDVLKLEKIARRIQVTKGEGGLRSAYVHENPFVGAEKQAISTCL